MRYVIQDTRHTTHDMHITLSHGTHEESTRWPSGPGTKGYLSGRDWDTWQVRAVPNIAKKFATRMHSILPLYQKPQASHGSLSCQSGRVGVAAIRVTFKPQSSRPSTGDARGTQSQRDRGADSAQMVFTKVSSFGKNIGYSIVGV